MWLKTAMNVMKGNYGMQQAFRTPMCTERNKNERGIFPQPGKYPNKTMYYLFLICAQIKLLRLWLKKE